jgi:LysR family transcriptional regulator, transcriptional activator for bauABCD operon
MKPRKPLPEFTDYDLRLLRVFDAVVRGSGFAGAEVLLNKSKSAISIDISSLETRLGVTLCRRGRSGFALTSHGKEIHALAQDLFRQLRDFRKRADLVATVVSGELSVALDSNLPGDYPEQFGSALRQFHAAHPQVTLKIDSGSPERVIQGVLDGSASLGISVIPREYPEIEAYPLVEENLSLFCAPGHPLYEVADAEVTIDRLATFDCVDLPSRHHAVGHEILVHLQMRVLASTPETQRLLISTGQFIGFLPQTYASSTLSTKKLRALSPDTLSFKCVVVEFVLRDVPKSLACEHFEMALRTAFGNSSRR